MRKLIISVILAGMLIVFAGCDSAKEEISFSENILFSFDTGGAGFGTMADCADAYIYVYTDRTVKVEMVDTNFSSIIEIGSFELSAEDYEKLSEIASPEKIYNLVVTDGEADDGSSYYITLYDENDQELIHKGGYMPRGEEFGRIYRSINEILEPYGIDEIIEQHRDTLGNA